MRGYILVFGRTVRNDTYMDGAWEGTVCRLQKRTNLDGQCVCVTCREHASASRHRSSKGLRENREREWKVSVSTAQLLEHTILIVAHGATCHGLYSRRMERVPGYVEPLCFRSCTHRQPSHELIEAAQPPKPHAFCTCTSTAEG